MRKERQGSRPGPGVAAAGILAFGFSSCNFWPLCPRWPLGRVIAYLRLLKGNDGCRCRRRTSIDPRHAQEAETPWGGGLHERSHDSGTEAHTAPRPPGGKMSPGYRLKPTPSPSLSLSLSPQLGLSYMHSGTQTTHMHFYLS